MQETNHIILNSKYLSLEEVKEKVVQTNSVSEWEKELYRFIDEWFSDADFVMAQTSGSTGEPKTIKLSKILMRKSAQRTIDYFGLEPNQRLLLSLPCRYIAGKMMVVRAIVGHMDLIAIDPATDFSILERESFDLGAMVSLQVYKLMNEPTGLERIIHIRNLLVGGSGISAKMEAIISTLPNRIVLTYGMTETASHIALRELSGSRRTDFYQCLRDISVDLQNNGCLRIKHPEFQQPLQTNDLAIVRSKTSFQILGRSDYIIISGGIKYSPEFIEKKLENLFTRPFVVSSQPDEKLGERITLVIEGHPFDTNNLIDQMSGFLTPFERPRHILFVALLPRTDNGKIKRNTLKLMIEKL
jgi:o-succinylbenzoate---CoA ligase